MLPTRVLLLSLLPFALAQSNDLQIQLKAIQAHFSNAGLVPSFLATFDPVALLTVTFDGLGAISPGQKLTQDQVKPAPTVVATPASASEALGTNFTLAMVDAGPVGSDQSKGQTRHWLVNTATLGPAPNSTVITSSGVAITEYAGPAPPPGSGPHRYVILLYAQPVTFAAPADLSTPNVGVSVFDVNAYAKTSGLGNILAATYFTVEEGQATFTPSPTSAVVSSTLAVASTGSSSSSASRSGNSTAPGSSSTSDATRSRLINSAVSITFYALVSLTLL